MPTLADAIELAVASHKGQVDKTGEAYILHPLRVMLAVRAAGGSVAAQSAAVLHDVMEDCGVTRAQLAAAGFSEDVIAGIESVTKSPADAAPAGAPDDEDAAYLRFVARAAANPIGRLGKRADLEDNMDVTRLATLTDKDAARLRRYLKAWHLLTRSAPAMPAQA